MGESVFDGIRPFGLYCCLHYMDRLNSMAQYRINSLGDFDFVAISNQRKRNAPNFQTEVPSLHSFYLPRN